MVKQLYCSPDTSGEIQGQLTFIAAINAFLSIMAFLGNTLILVALRKESSLHPPSKLLLSNLATTDLCVGLIVEPLYVTLWVTVVNEHWNVFGSSRIFYNELYFFWSVYVDTYCKKCGQTSRLVVGTEIQTNCNVKANLFDYYELLGC